MAQSPGAMKRQKELARLEWQKEKAEKRKQRRAEKKERGPAEDIIEVHQPAGDSEVGGNR